MNTVITYISRLKCQFLVLFCFMTQIALADSGATDRSKAYGYQFTQEELAKYPQKTNLPTIYLNVYKTTYDATTDATSLTGGVETLESLSTVFGTKNDWYYICNIVIRDDNGTIEERNEAVNMRGRGNATWDISNSLKKPMRLKFPAKTQLLGADFANAKNWVLLANFYDKSLIKNGLDYELGKYMDLPFCPAAKYVDLVVNGEYMGTYQISDKVEVAEKRIPGTKSSVWLEANSAKRSGFAEDPCFYTWDMGSALCVNIKNPDVDDISKSGDAFADATLEKIRQDALTLLSAVKSFNKESNTTYRKYIDFETAVDHFIALDITGNYDGDVANNYMYKEQADTKYKFGPIWDSDLAWGSNQGMKEKHFWEGETYGFGAACKKIFENDPYFMKLLYDRWVQIYNNGGLITYLNGKVDELAASISQSAALNFTAKSSGGAGYGIASEASWADGNSYTKLSDTYDVIKAFNTAHITWLNTKYKSMYDQLGCASYVMPDVDEGEEGGGEEAKEGLEYLGKGVLWGGEEQVYTYTGSASSMCTGATMTVDLEGSGAYMDMFADNQSTAWVSTYGGSPLTYTRTLTSDDVEKLKNASYIIKIAISGGGTCKSVSLSSGCTNHTYNNGNYAKQDNGTYRRACDKCGVAEENGATYYEFTVYPESAEKTTVYATSWQPSTDKPNSIATVKITPSGAEANITGYNIINKTSNADGNNTCADFRLTDGHPYYSENKFVATTATYERALTNQWGTICLPFKAQSAKTDHASFYHLAEASSTVLTFTPIQPEVDGNASAFVPLVFRATPDALSAGKLKVTAESVTVKKTTTAEMTNSTVTGWTLNGTVTNQTIAGGAGIYYIASNQFWLAEESFTLPPFRAYITSSTASDANYRIATDGEALGIEEVIEVTPQADQIFDLQGRHLAQPQQGINIINGKKVIVK